MYSDEYRERLKKLEEEQKKKSGSSQDYINSFLANNSDKETVVKSINSRVNTWLENNKNFIENYKTRYGGDNTIYRKDSADWLSTVTTQKSNFDKEAENILSLVNQYKSILKPEEVESIITSINSNRKLQSDILSGSMKDNERWSRFKTERDYDAFRVSTDFDNVSLSEIAKYANDTENPIAFTTTDGKNILWSDLYNTKRAQDDLSYRLRNYTSRTDWEENSAELKTINGTFSDYHILEEISLSPMPYDRETALKSGHTEDEFEEVDRKRRYINEKYGVNLHENIYDDAKIIGELMGKIEEEDETSRRVFEHLEEMTPEEKAVFTYIYNTEGRNAAYEWYNPRKGILLDRHKENWQTKWSETAKSSPVSASAASVLMSLAGGVEFITDSISMAVTGEEQYNDMAGASSAIRGSVSEMVDWNIGSFDAFDFVYNTGMSMADSVTSMGVFGKLGGVVQGLSAAGQAVNNALDRGMDNKQAFWTGLSAGVFECVFETLSIGSFNALKDGLVSGGKAFAKNLAKTMLVNASEEAATEVANILYDQIVNTDFSQAETSYRQYITSGMSEEEAKWKVFGDLASQVGESAASGALMGLGFGVVGNTSGAINYNIESQSRGQSIVDNGGVDSLKALADNVAGVTHNSDIKKLAGTVTSDATKSNIKNVGGLSIQTDEAISKLSKQNIFDITTALNARGVFFNEAKEAANGLNAALFGQELPSVIKSKIEAGDNAIADVYNSMIANPNSSVNRRMNGEYFARLKNHKAPAAKATGEELLGQHTIEKAEESTPTETAISAPLSTEEMARSVATERNTGVSATTEDSSTPAAETAENGQQNADTDARTIRKDTGEAIEIDEIQSIENGRMTLRLKDGKSIDSRSVEFNNQSDAVLYETVQKMDVNAAAANALIKAYDGVTDIDAYSHGIQDAFRYGKYNFPMSDVASGEFTSMLAEFQRNTAYRLGQQAAETEAAKKTAVVKTKGKGTVTYANGINKEELSPRQNTSIEVMERTAEVLGVNVHLYESKPGPNNTRYFIDENGKLVMNAPHGYYKSGEIYIDINAGFNGEQAMLFTFSHELAHHLRAKNKAQFKALADFLMQEYGRKGVSVEGLVQTQLEAVKKTHPELSHNEQYDIAYEEFVADSLQTMFTDGNLLEKLEKLKAKNKSLWETIKDFIAKFADKIRKAYKGVDPYSEEGKIVSQMKDSIEQIAQLFAEGLASTSANFELDSIYTDATDVSTDAVAVEDTTRFSYRSLAQAAGFEAREENGVRGYYRNDAKVSKVTVDDIEISPIGAMINFSFEMGDISEEDATAQKKLFADICTLACGTNDFSMTMQFVGSMVFTAMKANADKQYGTTYDFVSICTKTQAVIDAMSAKMVKEKRGLTYDEILKVYQKVATDGNPVPCPECYVFTHWVGIGGLLDKIYTYQTTYGNMSVEEAARAYADMYRKVEAYAKENNIQFGKAKGALVKKVREEYANLLEKIEKQENQGEPVKPKDRARLESLEREMVTVNALTWLADVYFAENPLDSNGNIKSNPKVNPNYAVSPEILFDLNRSEEFATQYAEAWGFRTTQGAGYGKAITPYAEAVLGEGILATNSMTNTAKAKTSAGRSGKAMSNIFLEQRGMMDKNARKVLARARLKQKIQAFLGGQRLQSTSDARYENASDYLLAALELQAMHGKAQVYTKVDGAVAAFDTWGMSSNQSLMPKGGGLDAKGNLKDTSSGGMNRQAAFRNREKHETSGTITIGVNDNHIRKLINDALRDFIIPYHASGGKGWLIKEFRRVQDGATNASEYVTSTDYTRTQGDKVLSDEVLSWQGKTPEEIARIHDIREARLAILMRGEPNMEVVRSNRFLSALYDKFNGGEWDGVKLPRNKVESQIFPNEFWDKSVAYENSGQITQDYLDYCADLGFLHRFSGKVPKNGILIPVTGYNERGEKVTLTDLAYKVDANGNQTNEIEPFFWKVLVDRRMFGHDGQYLEQRYVTLSTTTKATVTNFAKNNTGRQYDALLSQKTAAKVANTRYSSRAKAPTFYSHMARVAEGIQQEKIGAASVVSFLKGKGVKAEEIKWSGIEAWLEGKKSVTKQELLDFINNSQLQIYFEEQDGRWKEYTLDGGENYRELVFKLVGETYSNSSMKAHWGNDARGILAHARIQDFYDADGNKMLFIEEIQSDWHNEGHVKGYVTKHNYEVRHEVLDGNGDEIIRLYKDGSPTELFEYENGQNDDELLEQFVQFQEMRDIWKGKRPVPDAPFRDNYHEYVLKRLIRMAAEEGYDSIGWTPAEIQSERWSGAYAEGYRIEYDQDIPKFLRKYGKKWGATVGKIDLDVFRKAERSIEDDDWLSDAPLEGFDDGEVYDFNDGWGGFHGSVVWTMPITDSMKDSVLYEGQVRFSQRKRSKNTASQALDNYTEEQYNAFGWASYNNVITGHERETLLSRYADFRHNRDKYPVTKWGEAVIYSSECPNILMYVKGTITLPIITRVVRINDAMLAISENDVDLIREEVAYNERNRVYQPFKSCEDLFGFEIFSIHKARDYASFRQYQDSRREGRSSQESNPSAEGLQNRGRSDSGSSESNRGDDGVTRFSSRKSDGLSNRALLANALESTATDEASLEALRRYKKDFARIDELETALLDIYDELDEIYETQGRGVTAEVKALRDEAARLEAEITRLDKKLIRAETGGVLASILEREKAAVSRHYQDARKRNTEGRHKTIVRNKIKRTVKELDRLLNRGNRVSNVKTEVRDTVSSALRLSDLLFSEEITNEYIVLAGTVSANDAEKKLLAEYAQRIKQRNGATSDEVRDLAVRRIALLNKKLADLFARERAIINNTSVKKALSELSDAYGRLESANSDYVEFAYEEAVHERLKSFIETLDGTTVKDMSRNQLDEILLLYRAIECTVRESNSLFKKGQTLDRAQTTAATQKEILSWYKHPKVDPLAIVKLPSNVAKALSFPNLKPVAAFETLGSETFTQFFWDAIKAEGEWARIIDEASTFLDEQVKESGYTSWNMEERHTFTLPSGQEFNITLQEMMSIYAYYKREQAYGHMTVGGFQFPTDSTYEDVLRDKNGKPMLDRNGNEIKARRVHLSDTYVVDNAVLAQIIKELEDMHEGKVKGYVDAVQSYITEVLAAKGNEVSNILFGVDLFGEKAYMPLKSSSDFLTSTQTVLGKTQTVSSLKNIGMSKATVPNAENPIILQGFDQVVQQHIDEMAKYCAYVLPIENLRRVFDSVAVSDNGREYISTKNIIKKVYSQAAKDYFEKYITDLNGGTVVKDGNNLASKMFSNFKAVSVAASMSVVVQQPFAVTRAMAMISPKYFVFGENAKTDARTTYEEIKRYAPVAIIKAMGGFDMGNSRTAVEYLQTRTDKGIKRGYDELRDKSMWMAGKADELGWGILWNAVKREMAAKGKLTPGTEAFFEACGERFTEVIVYTQVYDSVNSRSGYMRSQNDTMKYWTSFMGEPTTTINMAYLALLRFARATKAEKAKALGGLTKVTGVLLVNSLLTTLAKSLVYAMRDDEDDEAFLEKWAKHFGDNVLSDLNPLNMLPFVRDVMSIIEGWDVERPDTTLISALVLGIKNLLDGDASVHDWHNFAGAVGNMIGLPVKNIIRDGKGIINLFEDIVDDIHPNNIGGAFVEGITGEDPADTDKLYRAIVTKDTGGLAVLKEKYKSDEAYNSALKKAIRDNDPRVKKAASALIKADYDSFESYISQIATEGFFDQEFVEDAIRAEASHFNSKIGDAYTAKEDGNTNKHNDIVKELRDRYRGIISQDEIVAKVKAYTPTEETEETEQAESIFKTSDINAALESGNTSKALEIIDDLIKVKTENYIAKGEKKKDAETKAKSSVKSSVTSYWKPLYQKAYLAGDTNEMSRIAQIIKGTKLYTTGLSDTLSDWRKSAKDSK